MKLLRMDCNPYPLHNFESYAFRNAGIDEIIGINDYSPQEILEHDADIIVVVSGYLPSSVIEKLSHCKLVLRMGTGYDKIDINAASKMGILVTYVPNYCIHDVAEHTITLMLAAARKLVELSSSMEDGTWMQIRRKSSIIRLFGKTLGVIGMGKIGKEVGRLGSAFGMKIIVYDKLPPTGVEYPYIMKDLDELLRSSDFISINCPLTDETRHLLGKEEFSKMQKNAILVNTARGAIITYASHCPITCPNRRKQP